MAKRIDVLAVGSWCKLRTDMFETVTARIKQINISGDEHSIQYEVVWFDGRTRNSGWFDAGSVEYFGDDAKRSIGFRS